MIDDIMKKYPNDVKIVFKSFPLSSHKQAFKAAKYVMAAGKQGKFKEMYHKIFDNYKDLETNENLPEDYARDLDLNMNQFIQDAGSDATTKQIEREKKEMEDRFERISVPKFLIQGKVPEKRNLQTFYDMIDFELRK